MRFILEVKNRLTVNGKRRASVFVKFGIDVDETGNILQQGIALIKQIVWRFAARRQRENFLVDVCQLINLFIEIKH